MEKRIYKILLIIFMMLLLLSFFLLWVDVESTTESVEKTGFEISMIFKIIFFIYLLGGIVLFFKEKIARCVLLTVFFIVIIWNIIVYTTDIIRYFPEIVRLVQGPYLLGTGAGYFVFLFSLFFVIFFTLFLSFKQGFLHWLLKKWHFYVLSVLMSLALWYLEIEFSGDDFKYIGLSNTPVWIIYILAGFLIVIPIYYLAYRIKFADAVKSETVVKNRMLIVKKKTIAHE